MNKSCPFCGSTEIYRLRRDSDWSGGISFSEVNESRCYTKEHDIPVVDIHFCGGCEAFFDPVSQVQSKPVIPVSAIMNRIETLKEHGAFKTNEYKDLCRIVTAHVTQGSFVSLATKIPEELEEVKRQYAYLKDVERQIVLLEHIVSEDSETITCCDQHRC